MYQNQPNKIFRRRNFGQPITPKTKIKAGIPGVLLIAAAFFIFLPHGIFGKKR
jgi:hypothetical protein